MQREKFRGIPDSRFCSKIRYKTCVIVLKLLLLCRDRNTTYELSHYINGVSKPTRKTIEKIEEEYIISAGTS